MVPRGRQGRQHRDERRAVLLLTNGRNTERSYLDGLKRRADRMRYSITVKFIDGDPLTVLKELSGPRWDLNAFDEVWIVVDHDGQDRSEFLTRCRKLSTRHTAVHGVVSVPCFEVWLIAHYAAVGSYPSQKEAQRHYREVTGLSRKEEKSLPPDFPWDQVERAATRCRLPHVDEPALDTQGPCPSTTMPHLLRSIGLITSS